MELRDHSTLVHWVAEYVRTEAWSFVAETIRRRMEHETIMPGWDIPLRKGIARYALIAHLGLESFMFLDVNFLDAFRYLPDESSHLKPLARENNETGKGASETGTHLFHGLRSDEGEQPCYPRT